jgi:hypothetical protein
MFSVDNFYNVIANNLLNPLKIHYSYFYPNGTFNLQTVTLGSHLNQINGSMGVFFWDQEPIDVNLVNKTIFSSKNDLFLPKNLLIANSDLCSDTHQISNYNWNYFFHGFAALDWYRDLYYLNDKHHDFDKVFITVNRLIAQERSYRLSLVAKLIKNNLTERGLISCKLHDMSGVSWKNVLLDNASNLTTKQKIEIFETFSKLDKNLILDNADVLGASSALIDRDQRDLFKKAFCHVVTETIFYPNKLHLTEKIFRPIVFQRPFILAGGVGNLQYLKKYGFESFSNWWDESYDQEVNHDLRLEKIISIIQKLNQHSMADLKEMYFEMLPVIEHNYEHFYGKFKQILVNEMLDNFTSNLDLWNSCNLKKYNYKKVLDINRIKMILHH